MCVSKVEQDQGQDIGPRGDEYSGENSSSSDIGGLPGEEGIML